MYQYLFLIPMGVIYFALYWLIVPQMNGRWTKVIIALLLIPIAYIITGYVDEYLPGMLYAFARFFRF